MNGKADIVNALINANASLNIGDTQGRTALIRGTLNIYAIYLFFYTLDFPINNLASLNGKLDIVNALISANSSLNLKDTNGYPALIWGEISIRSMFFYSIVMSDCISFFLASRNGYLDILNALISANISLNIRDNQGYTALIWGKITI